MPLSDVTLHAVFVFEHSSRAIVTFIILVVDMNGVMSKKDSLSDSYRLQKFNYYLLRLK